MTAAPTVPSDPFRDRVAVVTGGGAGIGRALAQAFAARGAKVVIADLDAAAAERTAAELARQGAESLAVATDVTDRASALALAERSFARFGAVHLLCNNAGIAVAGPLVGADPDDWRRAMAVNFWGVVHGIDAFLPRMVAQRQGGHVVNTSSMAGLVGMDWLGIYCATKFAVVGLSESLLRELSPHGIGVSVLCPMRVATRIAENSARVLGRATPTAGEGGAAAETMDLRGGVIAPEAVADRVVRAIETRRFYVLTHPEQREILRRRARRIEAAFDAAS